jgi:hypothetical protein
VGLPQARSKVDQSRCRSRQGGSCANRKSASDAAISWNVGNGREVRLYQIAPISTNLILVYVGRIAPSRMMRVVMLRLIVMAGHCPGHPLPGRSCADSRGTKPGHDDQTQRRLSPKRFR